MSDKVLDVNMPMNEIQEKILTETDLTALDNIIDLFNLNIRRKDIIRTGKLNELQDKITEQMANRIEQNANQFSNKDLVEYFKVIQSTIDKSANNLDDIDKPAIQLNQVNINVEDKLGSESRRKVLDAVNAILNSANTQENIIDAEFKEEVEEETND